MSPRFFLLVPLTLGLLAAPFLGGGLCESGTPSALASENAVAKVGEAAPLFTLTDTEGKVVALADLKGKTVVLEWFNPDCPFVRYAHGDDGPLKTQPARLMGEGVVWLAVNSSASGKQGSGAQRNSEARAKWSIDYPVLMDPDGLVGRRYGAKTTPHMFVIDPTGALVYAGALDDAPMGRGKASNYVDQALTDLKAGQPVQLSSTKAYGCSVKY